MSRPHLQVEWHDDRSDHKGYLVVDRLGRGVASGGLRMRAGVTMSEVSDLARGMSLKEAVAYRPSGCYVPVGGAKGGIDCDPQSPEAQDVLTRYLAAMRPYLREVWATGEDLGLRQDQIDEAAHEVGLRTTIDAVLPLLPDVDAALQRIATAFSQVDQGIDLDELVGGCGVAEAALVALEQDGIAPAEATAVVQGFGSIGGATARFLARAGVRVVAVSDAVGVVSNPAGLDVEALLAGRDEFGQLDRATLRPEDATAPRSTWLDHECDVLVPAAISYVIGPDEAPRVRARWVVEGANVPVTAPAEALLEDRGVRVVPDFVANSSTNSWWWWVLFGDVAPTIDDSYALIREVMRDLVTRMLERSAHAGCSLRAAAVGIAEENLVAIAARAAN